VALLEVSGSSSLEVVSDAVISGVLGDVVAPLSVNANAVPAVTARAPAAMAPTSSFLVMSVPFHIGSGTDHGAGGGPMAALPDG
jgi:hypothetical protein